MQELLLVLKRGLWASLEQVELELVALVAQMVPLDSWLVDPSQLGPLVPSKSPAGAELAACGGAGIVGMPGTGHGAILGCDPCSCQAAFRLFQPPASGKKCAAGTDPGKTESMG